MTKPRFLSVFSGVGGFDLGLERAGWECAGQIEVDPFCNRVLARHWPDTPRWGDVRSVNADAVGRAVQAHPRGGWGSADAAGLRAGDGAEGRGAGPGGIDLLCGGFPCQDLSVAGRRAGLSGARSGLFFELVRLARELRPTWLLLENVPGLLSSNGGRDFAVVLAALGDAGYGVGWRVLDARWFGVPQRRRRVFLVGCLGAPCPAEVLLEPEGVLRDLAPGDEAGADVAYSLGRGTDRFGEGSGPWSTNYVVDDEVAGTLGGGSGDRGWCSDVERMTFVPYGISEQPTPKWGRDIFPALDANHGGGGRRDAVAYGIRTNQTQANGPNVWKNGTGALQVDEAPPAVQLGAAVRRLTPTECARLQGFPDDWNCLCGVQPYSTWDCVCPDGPRYATYGNAVCVPVIEWLGRRLLAATRNGVS
jgi:DNA (cytosine-5)-methyltransferase 1